MKGKKLPKILAFLGTLLYVFVSWCVVKLNDPKNFDILNEIIIDFKVKLIVNSTKLMVIIIVVLGLALEFWGIKKKIKKLNKDFTSEYIGICLNLMLLSFTFIPFWTIFYLPK